MPLHSAEPAPIDDTDRAQLTLAPDEKISQMSAWVNDLAAQRQAFREKIDERQALTKECVSSPTDSGFMR